jgi:hypothetical protein
MTLPIVNGALVFVGTVNVTALLDVKYRSLFSSPTLGVKVIPETVDRDA